jgi:hypothetical protein
MGRYNMKAEKLRNDVGITIMPNNNKFYYVGVANIAEGSSVKDEKEKNNINKLEALLGFRAVNSEIYGGVIKGKAGVGFGYSFFQPIYAPYKRVQTYLNTFDFGRENHGPQIDAGVMVGVAKWLYAGVEVEDISYRTDITPYIKIEIDDKDLAALLGIISVAAVAAK